MLIYFALFRYRIYRNIYFINKEVDFMDVAAMSVSMSLANVQMQAGLAMTKNAMDTAEAQMAQLLEGMQAANPPSSHIVDMLVYNINYSYNIIV